MQTPVQIGPFAVVDHVGAGGMGKVYRARHSGSGKSVALKVAHEGRARSSDGHSDFRREAQALAKLYHPAIAAIVDFGELSGDVARKGPGSWVEGAPWFAMEFVEGTPLDADERDWTWEELRSFLGTVLDALAHAHARSVIHRDLKPSNIMVEQGSPGETSRVKLVDFGIARLFGVEATPIRATLDEVAGTPTYMAPEQIRGEWRRQGPHTDLYSLGCLTWRLLCGRPPFQGETTDEILENHLDRDLPAFEPRLSVPEGLEPWLRNLLRNDPERRTSHAADAAHRLVELDRRHAAVDETSVSPDISFSPDERRPTLGGLTETLDDGPSESTDGRQGATTLRRGGRRDAGRRSSPTRSRRPIPTDWRRHRDDDRSAAVLPRTGLRLFPLREIPVVDRESERETLWQTLRNVDEFERPQLVTLEGGPGTGKSRLARWLGRRADELGAAEPLVAFHSEASEPHEGLRDMFRRHFETAGLPRDDLFEYLLNRLPSLEGSDGMLAADARALTELLRPTADDEAVEGPRHRFSEPYELYASVRNVLTRLTNRRRVVVWFDDLQWGPEAIGVLEALFDGAVDDREILVVATLRSDVLAEKPAMAERLEALLTSAGARRISLDPLDRESQRELVDRLLDLDASLADRLAARTEGHPLFTVQLLQDWVGRGLLVEGDEGFELLEDADPSVPDDIHETWLGRIRHLVESFDSASDDTIWRALEWAALLGRDIASEEWDAIVREEEVPDELRERLVSRGLAEETDRGWAFAHHLLVQSLRDRAEAHGRSEAHHARSAELLEGLDDAETSVSAGRRADHWEAAGEYERALAALKEKYERLATRGAFDALGSIVRRHEHLLEALDVPEDDPRRIEHDIERGVVGVRTGRLQPDGAIRTIESAAERADAIGRDDLVARAHARAAVCRHRGGDLEGAAGAAERAVEAAERSDSAFDRVRARHVSGDVARERGELEDARRHYAAARDGAADIDDRYQTTKALRGMAEVALTAGALDRARALYSEVLERSRRAGFRRYEASALSGLGHVARLEGDAPRARERYHDRLELAQTTHDRLATAEAHLDLAQTELMADAFEAAGEAIDAADAEVETEHRFPERRRLIALAMAAGDGDWSRFDELFDRYADGWPDSSPLVVDHPWLLETTARFARREGGPDRARSCLELAAVLRRELGDSDAADDLDRRISELDE